MMGGLATNSWKLALRRTCNASPLIQQLEQSMPVSMLLQHATHYAISACESMFVTALDHEKIKISLI